MRRGIKKFLKIISLTVGVFLMVAFLFIRFYTPDISPEVKKVFREMRALELDTLRGKKDFALNGDTRIWYQRISPRDSVRGHVLLIMGISIDGLAWPDYFINPLLDAGYQVIRMDNRGTGMSDWVEDWSQEKAYTLEDMALDGIAVLDTLNIDKVHVIGASLGGMIAQTMAIEHPDRMKSLTSMMSSGYIMDPELPSMRKTVLFDMMLVYLRYGLFGGEKGMMKMQYAARMLLRGDKIYDLPEREIAEIVLYNLRHRKGYNMDAAKQQSAAVLLSGSRYEALRQLELPALVIHGLSDPLIPFVHGEKCARHIPNAKKLWVEGMGHDIPPVFSRQILDIMIPFLHQAETPDNKLLKTK